MTSSTSQRGDMEKQIYNETKARQDMRPTKRNNQRQGVILQNAKRSKNECSCGGTDFEESDYQLVCVNCGVVQCAVSGGSVYDHDRVVYASTTKTTVNYFNERLSQWMGDEPPIPYADRKVLVAQYNRGYGPGGSEATGLYYDITLPKHEVRNIIVDAGLSPRKYTEKWLSIREILGAPAHPKPSEPVRRQLLAMFKEFDIAWKSNPHLHPDRSSLPNYNFLICQFLLRISLRYYLKYYEWLPQVDKPKRDYLLHLYAAVCRTMGWTVYYAVEDNGVWKREEFTPELQKEYMKLHTVKLRRKPVIPVTKQLCIRCKGLMEYERFGKVYLCERCDSEKFLKNFRPTKR